MDSTSNPIDTKQIEALLRELIDSQKESQHTSMTQQIGALSLRRQEIVHMIRDHQPASFDFLARNFRGVTIGTLHYDLNRLVKGGYIRKLGTTRGVLYVPSE